MSNKKDLLGQVFTYLTVIAPAEPAKDGRVQWRCRCICGKECVAKAKYLLNGEKKSCGCRRKLPKTHGDTCRGMNKYQRLYRIWANMLGRCRNPNAPAYKYYGGRGIIVCDEWKDYAMFKAWATTHGYADDLTIERIDVNGNYEPDNCTWILPCEQPKNQRARQHSYLKGERVNIKKLARDAGMNYHTLRERLADFGMTLGEALTKPVRPWRSADCLTAKAIAAGINPTVVYKRIERGWSIERALSEPVHKEFSHSHKEKKDDSADS